MSSLTCATFRTSVYVSTVTGETKACEISLVWEKHLQRTGESGFSARECITGHEPKSIMESTDHDWVLAAAVNLYKQRRAAAERDCARWVKGLRKRAAKAKKKADQKKGGAS